MRLICENTVLRAPVSADVDDYRRWVYEETEWMQWDAPWEGWNEGEDQEFVEQAARRAGQTPEIFYRLEIETAEGVHIGWVSSYDIDGTGKRAVGIDIPEQSARGKGHGECALRMFIDYLLEKTGKSEIYTQTWSGNARMIRLAEKLGFAEIERNERCREVDGQLFDALTFILER